MRAFFLFFVATLSAPAWAWACSFPGPKLLEIEANPADVTAPSTPALTVRQVKRGNDWGGDEGCAGGGTATSCDGSAFVLLDAAATDDVTASSQLGYRVEAPELVDSGKVLVPSADGLRLHLRERDSGEGDLTFTLKISTVDQAGNVSEERSVEVHRDGDGCQLGRGPSGALLITLTLATRRALCRRTRGAAASRP